MSSEEKLMKELRGILHSLGVSSYLLKPKFQRVQVSNHYGDVTIPECWIRQKNMRLMRHAIRRLMPPDRRSFELE